MPAPAGMLELQNLLKHIVVVEGNVVTFNFSDVVIKDNILQLNANNTHNITTGTAGLAIDRLTEDQVKILWDEAVSAFKIQKGNDLTDLQFRKTNDGWKDLIGIPVIPTKSLPGTAPLWMDIGNGMWGWSFSDNLHTPIFVDFHILHDIKIGSKLYPHIHWIPMSHSTGNVVWKIEYIFAKGHQQSEILTAPTTSTNAQQNGKGLIGEHMIAEVTTANAFITPEVDSIVKIKVSRDVNNPADTFYGNVVLMLVDLHYQADRIATVNKSPDFYGGKG